MGALNNAQTQDNYSDDVALRANPATTHVSTHIFNTGVYLQFALVDQQLNANAFDYNSSEYLMSPGYWTWDSERDFGGKKIAGVRARSSFPSAPATVNFFA